MSEENRVPADFAWISLVVGDCFYEIAQVKADGREENLLLAIKAYKRALSFYTQERFPSDYAMIQDKLVNVQASLAAQVKQNTGAGP